MNKQAQDQIQSAVSKIFGQDFITKTVRLAVFQSHDERTGNAKGLPAMSTLDIGLIDPRSKDLFDWMVAPSKKVDGLISFQSGTKMVSEIKFKGGSLVGYTVSWSENADLTVDLKISSNAVEMEGVNFNRS